MKCERVTLADGQVAIVCSRKARVSRCKVPGCTRAVASLCDGHTEATNPDTAKPDGCDLPICAHHAVPIGQDAHLCPRCAARAREVFEDLRRRCVELGEPIPRRLVPLQGEVWPEVHRGAYLVVSERPVPFLWFVGGTAHQLRIDAEIRWELEKLPGILALS